MARPNLHQDPRNSNLTTSLETKRKLAALGYDKGISMSQMLTELVAAAPKPRQESQKLAEKNYK